MVRLSRALPHNALVKLVDKLGAFPTGEHSFDKGESEANYLRIYDSDYYIKVESNWFKEQNKLIPIRNATTIVNVPIEYLEFADSNGNDIEGSWSESPIYIFDGGGK